MTTELQVYEPMDWYADVPRRISRIGTIGLLLMVVAFGGFGFWSLTAPLAAAVISQGSFVATGYNKILQHLEGGIIKSILVSEGDAVEAGQTLVLLDETAAKTRQAELGLRLARLGAINSRLLAEYQGLDEIAFPPDLLEQASDPKVAEIIQGQRENFAVFIQKKAIDIQLIEANIAALEYRISGFTNQRSSLVTQISTLNEDLLAKTALFDIGLIRKPEINALLRAVAEGEGQTARLSAEIGESTKLIGKYERQIDQTRQAYSQAALDEIQSVQAEYDSVTEQLLNARDILRRTKITAPVSGTVLRVYYHTAGGVIQAGKPILEILPLDAPLMIEALIPRTEIDSVTLGHTATIRLVGLNQRTTPVLHGQVYYVSADAIPDTTSGAKSREVYLARIKLSRSELDRVPDFSPTPGMPAEILIKTQERTFFQYLTKPIADSMSRAFRED